MTILTLDPGNSTGWLWCNIDDKGVYSIIGGGTIAEDHLHVAKKIYDTAPDLVIFETFHMYPGKAKSLAWNSFYPCEVIGVIKYICALMGIKTVGLSPSTKKYAGGFNNPEWIRFRQNSEYTEHTKDTWLLFQYWYRNKYKKAGG